MYHLVGGWFPGGNQSSLTGYRGGLQESTDNEGVSSEHLRVCGGKSGEF